MPVTMTLLALFALGCAVPVLAGFLVLSAERGHPPRLTLAWLSMLLREISANMLALAIWPLGSGDRHPELGDPGGPRKVPVILVPGFGMNRSCLWALQALLRRRGWRWVHAINRARPGGGIDPHARALAAEVERLCRVAHSPQVDIVAHSMGGLIAAWYIQELGGAARVRRLVTLGTPWGGTRMASLVPWLPDSDLLVPGSKVVQELREPQVPTHAIWSYQDQLVVPTHSAAPDWLDRAPHGQTALRLVGHLDLLGNTQSLDRVCALLSAPPQNAPTESTPTKSSGAEE
ncbi:MAG: alpha/beta fold hydrolase [Myxococcota bacterium]|nr:alpha/beta fold hydrolase [Myxococcota bacterium]